MKSCFINFRAGALMFLAAALWLGLAAPAGAADVILTKTQRLTGKVMSADGKSVKIEIAGQGVVAIPRSSIEKMSVEAPPAVLRGVEAYEKGAFKEAQLTLAKVAYQFIGLDTDWAAKALVYYARVCLMNGDNAGAEKAFNTFIEVYDEDPLVVDAELGLAETQLAKNDVDKAFAKFQELAEEYEKVVRPPMDQFPYAAEAFLGMGKCLEAKQDFAGAANAYLKVIALFPADSSLPEALYRAAALYKTQKPEYAGMFLNDLISQYPASPFARKAADLQRELGVKK